jgi:hypothetical protein
MSNTSITVPGRKDDARPRPFSIVSLASGLRCEPGDLAIVGGKDAFEENLGCIVEVIAAAYISDEHGFMWSVRSVGRPLMQYDGSGGTRFAPTGYAPDSHLTPIKGIPSTEVEGEDAGLELTAEVH